MKRRIRFFLLVVMFFAVTAFSCGGKFSVPDDVKQAARVSGVQTSEAVQQTTPNGTRVAGVFRLDAVQLAAIDAGLAAAFADARTSGYTRAVDHPAFFYISTPLTKCVPSPEQGVLSFYVRADDYDGTEFDQYNSQGKGVRDGIGVIFASEMVLSLGTPGSTLEYGWMVVCPDAGVIGDAVRNGAEHIIIANNDPDYYGVTWFHGYGFYHPLLPKHEPPSLVRPTIIKQGASQLVRAVR